MARSWTLYIAASVAGRRAASLLACVAWLAASPAVAAPKVVVTSKPAHSLVASVMEGIGSPVLLVEGAASPHSFTLKPSMAREIAAADVFVRISTAVEPFTLRLMATLPSKVATLTLADVPGLTLHQRRKGATFETGAHAGHDKGHDHDHDDHEASGGPDGHVWLDPMNVPRLAASIASTLSTADPANKATYEANAAALAAKAEALSAEIAARMAPLAGRRFVVFHDATQYFERRFGLEAAGAITVSPDVQPSAKRLSAVRKRIMELGAVCVFAEPAYQQKLVAAVTEGTAARAGIIDPEALKLTPGPGLYAELMRTLAASFEACLARPS